VSAHKTESDQLGRKPGNDDSFERRGRRLSMNRRLFFFGEGDFEGEATVLDISTNGCQATSLTEVKVGKSLKLSLFLQDQQWPLRIDQAVVRWVDGQCFGMEFTGIRPAQRERLRAILMRVKE
jgi:PilZ domain